MDASGYSYIVPREKRGKAFQDANGRWQKGELIEVEATYQIGYRGYIELAKRSKDVSAIDSFVVYQGEYEKGAFSGMKKVHSQK